MPAHRSALRKIKDVLRLKFEASLSNRQIAAATGLSKAAVTKYLSRAAEAGLGWPLPPELDEATLERRLFPSAVPSRPPHYALPDCAALQTASQIASASAASFLLLLTYGFTN